MTALRCTSLVLEQLVVLIGVRPFLALTASDEGREGERGGGRGGGRERERGCEGEGERGGGAWADGIHSVVEGGAEGIPPPQSVTPPPSVTGACFTAGLLVQTYLLTSTKVCAYCYGRR